MTAIPGAPGKAPREGPCRTAHRAGPQGPTTRAGSSCVSERKTEPSKRSGAPVSGTSQTVRPPGGHRQPLPSSPAGRPWASHLCRPCGSFWVLPQRLRTSLQLNCDFRKYYSRPCKSVKCRAHRPDESRQGLVPALGPGSAPGCREGGPTRACTVSFPPRPTDLFPGFMFQEVSFFQATRKGNRFAPSFLSALQMNKINLVHVFVFSGEKNPKPLPWVFKERNQYFSYFPDPKRKKKPELCTTGFSHGHFLCPESPARGG